MAQNFSKCMWQAPYKQCWSADRYASRFLDAKDATSLEYKLDSFSSVYRRLTGKDVVFEFPVQAQE